MLFSDEPYELEEKIDSITSMPTEGLQEEPPSTTEGMMSGTPTNDIPMEQG